MAKLANAPRMLRARVDAKGRITVPKALRLQMGMTPGSQDLLRAAGEGLHGIAVPVLLRRLRAARRGLQQRLTKMESERDG
jgi:AbrB family looped-hinge helix DNA binding protein